VLAAVVAANANPGCKDLEEKGVEREVALMKGEGGRCGAWQSCSDVVETQQ
jgi:hypothetical protein